MINNRWVEPAEGKYFETLNPATGKPIAKVAEGTAADIDKAVKAARAALENPAWKKMTPADRGRLLYKLADLVEENAEELATLESLNCGKTITDSRGDVEGVVNMLRYYAGWADKIEGRTVPVRGSFLSYTLRQPVGVVGQIIPWNFPLLMLAWKWGPALACGNTVVMKPAEQTPLTALRLAELAIEAGFPAGVINIVNGFGETAGAALVDASGRRQDRLHRPRRYRQDHPEDRRRHAQAQHLRAGRQEPQRHLRRRRPGRSRRRRVPRHLLPRRPVLHRRQPAVRRGEDPRRVRRAPGREGQTPPHRRPARSEDRARPAGLAGAARQDPRLRQAGREAGGRARHRRRTRSASKGFFVEPTIFDNVKDDMAIAKDEIFGPVVSVLPFKDVDEVIDRANSTHYGLAAGVWTKDIDKAHLYAAEVKAGTVWVNCYHVVDTTTPFGGFKISGKGRENGEAALEHYTETKTVTIKLHE